MEKEFLHNVNLDLLQKETGMTLQGIADLVNVSLQTVYRWAWDKSKQGNRPSYNAFIRLLERGATCKTLFGVSPKDSVQKESPSKDDFLASVKQALADIALGTSSNK